MKLIIKDEFDNPFSVIMIENEKNIKINSISKNPELHGTGYISLNKDNKRYRDFYFEDGSLVNYEELLKRNK